MGFLGTAWAVSTSSRDNTSLFLTTEKTAVLIDCPGNVWGKLLKMGFDPLKLEAIFITHGHVDHVYGLPSLLEMMRLSGRKSPMKIHVGKDFRDRIERLLDLFEIEKHADSFRVDLLPLEYEETAITIGDLSIGTFPVKHTVKNLALKFATENKSVVYSSDTAFFEPLADFAKGCDVLVHEATMSTALGDNYREGHSTPSDAARIAERAGVKRLFLVHVGYSVAKQPEKAIEEAKKHFRGEVFIPHDLDVYEI